MLDLEEHKRFLLELQKKIDDLKSSLQIENLELE